MAITYQRKFREQFNNLTPQQKKFLKLLATFGDGQDIADLNEASLLIEIKKEDASITLAELRNLILSLKCIH